MTVHSSARDRTPDQAVERPRDFIHLTRIAAFEELTFGRGSKPVLRLVERATGNEEDPTLVGLVPPTDCLGDVGPDRIDRANELKPRRPTLEAVPTEDLRVNSIAERDSVAVSLKVSKRATAHQRTRAVATILAPVNCQLSTVN